MAQLIDTSGVVRFDGEITGGVQMTSLTLNSAQLLALTDVEVLPAPGGRLYYVLMYVVMHYRFGTVPYVADLSDVFFIYGTSGDAEALCWIPGRGGRAYGFLPEELLQQTEDAYIYAPVPDTLAPNRDYSGWLASAIEDKAITLVRDGAAFTGGDGSLTMRLFYSLIDGAP